MIKVITARKIKAADVFGDTGYYWVMPDEFIHESGFSITWVSSPGIHLFASLEDHSVVGTPIVGRLSKPMWQMLVLLSRGEEAVENQTTRRSLLERRLINTHGGQLTELGEAVAEGFAQRLYVWDGSTISRTTPEKTT